MESDTHYCTLAGTRLGVSGRDEKKLWSRIGVSFAMVYATLAVVIPFSAKGLGNQVILFNITSAQPASQGIAGWVSMFFLLHGLLAPMVILPLWVPPLLLLGALWFITAPVALLLLTLFFKNLLRQP